MPSTSVNQNQFNQEPSFAYPGQRWLVEERDACGVGFIADQHNRSSHSLVARSLDALTCMEHRGACSADQDSGDGAGLMTAVPVELLQDWLTANGIDAIAPFAVGMVFLPQDEAIAESQARSHPQASLNFKGGLREGWMRSCLVTRISCLPESCPASFTNC